MTASGEHFLARQAILNQKKEVYAYELLFRAGVENFFPAIDGDQATARVIADSFLLFGIDKVTGQAKAFINFTRGLLLKGRPLLLPRKRVVVEILETVEPEPAVLESCRDLKRQGYLLALDDFVLRPDYGPFLELADIVKVDFRATSVFQRTRLAKDLRAKNITLLAEKVETNEEFQEGLRLGYQLFQGYFFSRPVLVSRRNLPSVKVHYLRFLKEVNAPEMDYDSLARLIQADVSLSLKLLHYINSAAFSLRQPVTSIKQALAFLGEREVRRWASLLALGELAADKPAELMRSALVRGRLAELVSRRVGLGGRSADLFLMGLLSLLDAMLGRPMPEILAELPLADDLKEAIQGQANRLGQVLTLVVAQERGDWAALDPSAASLGLPPGELPELYLQAVAFPGELGI